MSDDPRTRPSAMQSDLAYVQQRAQRPVPTLDGVTPDEVARARAAHLVDAAANLIGEALNINGLERGPYTDRMVAALEELGGAYRELEGTAPEPPDSPEMRERLRRAGLLIRTDDDELRRTLGGYRALQLLRAALPAQVEGMLEEETTP